VIDGLGTLALALVAGAAFTAATSRAVAALWPALAPRLRRRDPALRARVALGAAVAPSVLPVLLLGLCFAPGVLGWLGLHADHCVHHPGHPHLCLVHATVPFGGPQAALLLAAGAGLAVAGVSVGRAAARTRRTLARLRAGAAREIAPGVHCVDSERPFSLTAGLAARGEIFVSSALARALAPEQLAAVVAHERAHARRRDGLRRLAAHAGSWAHGPRLRRALLAELDLATERACDEEAGRRVGDRLLVAEAILAVERLLARAPGPTSGPLLAFGGSSVAARVTGLIEEPGEPAPRAVWLALPVVTWAAASLAEPLHHVTEHVLAVLFAAH